MTKALTIGEPRTSAVGPHEPGPGRRDPDVPQPRETEAHGPQPERLESLGPQPAIDPPTWRSLYDDLGERVFRLIYRMTRDEHSARDLTHDTFVRVFESIDQYAGRGSVRRWVFKIAANLVRERGRTANRRSALLDREAPAFRRTANDHGARIESRMVLDHALAQLPEDQRVALLLHEVDGYSHNEIGEMLGIATGSSKARVSRAKATLRELLKGRI